MQYASFSRRASALTVDSIWWTAIVLFVPLGPSTEDVLLGAAATSSIGLWLVIGQCLPIMVTGLIWAIWGTTPGKRLLHMQIVDVESGEKMSATQAALRTFGYLLTFAICGAGFLWVFFNPRKQALHDRIANTVVIEVPKGIS